MTVTAGLSKLLKQVLPFTIFTALCFSRELNKFSFEFSVLELPTNTSQSYVELKASRKLPTVEIKKPRKNKKSHFTFRKFGSINTPSTSLRRLSLFNFLQPLRPLFIFCRFWISLSRIEFSFLMISVFRFLY